MKREDRQKFYIGLFVLATIALLAGSAIFFGLTGFKGKRVEFLTFFNESVRGLDQGSMVRFKGVPVGQVTRIRITLGKKYTGSGIPVNYEIDASRLTDELGVSVDVTDEQVYLDALRDGLTAELETESLLTGKLYINLDFRPGTKTEVEQIQTDLREIPAVPSRISNFSAEAARIIEDFGAIDLAGLSANVNSLVVNLDKTLNQVDLPALTADLRGALGDARANLLGTDSKELIHSLRETSAQLKSLASHLETETSGLAPQVSETLAEINRTTEDLRTLSRAWSGLEVESRPPLPREVLGTVAELQSTLSAIRDFVDFLNRHPEALIRGRATP